MTEARQRSKSLYILNIFGCFVKMKRICYNIVYFVHPSTEQHTNTHRIYHAYLLLNDIAINIYSFFICSFFWLQTKMAFERLFAIIFQCWEKEYAQNDANSIE